MTGRPFLSSTAAVARRIQPLISRATPAGPSRLPLCRFNATSTQQAEGITEICLRAELWPTMLHVYAAMRAVEARLGTVIDIDVPRNHDTLQPDRHIFLSLLHPIKLAEPIHMEIPPPAMSSESTIFGGPSWVDICRVLSSSHVEGSTGQIASRKGRNEMRIVDRSIRFSIEKREGLVRNRGRARLGKMKTNRTKKDMEEDAEIIEALRALGPGAHGGFEGLAEKLSYLGSESREEDPASLGAQESPAGAEVSPHGTV